MAKKIMKRIGITGSRGFIGTHIADALKQNPHNAVQPFDLPRGNLLKAGTALEAFVKNKDVIIHAAAVNRGSDTAIIAGSIVATHNLLSAIEKSKNRVKIIFLSSIQAENDTVYGRSKRIAELMLEDFSKRNKTTVSIIRLPNIFGKGCKPFYNSVVATFCYQIARGETPTIHPKSRNKKIGLLSVKEVTKVVVKEVRAKHRAFFDFKAIAPQNELSVEKLARIIQSFRTTPCLPKKTPRFIKNLYETYQSYA